MDSRWVSSGLGVVEWLSLASLSLLWVVQVITSRPGEATEVDFHIEFEIGPGSNLLEPVIHRVLGDVAAMQVNAFEDRCRLQILQETELVRQRKLRSAVGVHGVGEGPGATGSRDDSHEPGRWPSPVTGRILQR